jgi:ice-binding like protein
MKALVLAVALLGMVEVTPGQAPPLGYAQSFAVLGATTVTSAGPVLVTGDVGVSPGTSITGFPPGTISGGILNVDNPLALLAQRDAQTAYAALAADPCGTNLSGETLGSTPGATTLSPGVYCFNSSAELIGALTLSGAGVYIFQIGSTLTTATSSSVILSNGASSANVFWQVGGSATIGSDTAFTGSIFAAVSDTVSSGASVAGRVLALAGAVTLSSNSVAIPPGPGRWEIVHITGDNSGQSPLYPGGFSTYLKADGSGYVYGTFSDSSCVIDSESFNLQPSWVDLGGNTIQITVAVNNLGLGPDFSFVYSGTYNPVTAVPGDSSEFIPAITGTYYAVGDVSACSATTQDNPGTFVATFLPTLSSGSTSGSLDSFSADNGSTFDSTVGATLTFAVPEVEGQVAGTVALDANPMLNQRGCFATTDGVVDPLTINSSKSIQSGVSEYIFAEGFDPRGVPTTLFLNGYSTNIYSGSNTDLDATKITATEWAVPAAIGDDDPAAGTAGVSNDGTNTAIVVFYGVLGGECNNAGGVDTPFYFLSSEPHPHRHKHHHPRARRRFSAFERFEPVRDWRDRRRSE